jgi:hypothetical protein
MADRPIARGMRPDRPTLDEASASRILQGIVHPDDAPPGYASVAGLLASAAQPAAVDEDAAAATISAMVGAIRGSASTPQVLRRKSMLKKLLAGKALAAVGIVALTASGAAAATGSLPDPVQSVIAGAVSHVGVDLPQPGDHGNSAGHRQDGLHRPSGDDTTTSSTVDTGNGPSANHGPTVSDAAHNAPDGEGKGPTVCVVASQGKCQAGDDHGKGSGDETTSSTFGSSGQHGAQGEVSDAPAEDHESQAGEPHEATSTTVTTGSPATGKDHSGSSDSGKGGSGSHH